MRWKLEEVTEDWRKEVRREEEEEEKEGPTRRIWRGIGRLRERRSEIREETAREPGEEEARDFFTEEGRDGKGSFVDLGSRWDWWVRKESRPGIVAEMTTVAVVVRSRIRRRMVEVEAEAAAEVGIFFGVLGFLRLRWVAKLGRVVMGYGYITNSPSSCMRSMVDWFCVLIC